MVELQKKKKKKKSGSGSGSENGGEHVGESEHVVEGENVGGDEHGGGGDAATPKTPAPGTGTSTTAPTVENPEISTAASIVKQFTLRNFIFISSLLSFSYVTKLIHNKVYEVQEDPYMDEIFHIPQTMRYFVGRFSEWDPKITTLPGSYVVANALLNIWNFFSPAETYDELCNVYNLRMVNVAACIMNFCLIYHIVGKYNPTEGLIKRLLSTFNIATFPVLYFFSFLFYTDAISTCFLLMMHVLFLNAHYGNSAFAGAWAVFCRQTNIVWVFFHGVNTIIQVMLIHYGDMVYLIPLEGKKFFYGPTKVAYHKGYKGKRNFKMMNTKTLSKPVRPLLTTQVPNLARIWKECGDEFIDQGYGYIFVGIIFCGFVFFNGSIVVGDKEAHQAVLNVPQIFYFALVFGIFTVSFMATRIKIVGAQILSSPRNTVILCVLFAIVIFFNTPVHPYLIADNRHYTFYVWKRFYENIPYLRYLWIPFYVMVWSLIGSATCLPRVVVLNYILCVCINLIPQLLMEFRYFIPAYMYARLTFKRPSWFELILECYIHVCFNYLTLNVFINRPFLWKDSDDLQRFMW